MGKATAKIERDLRMHLRRKTRVCSQAQDEKELCRQPGMDKFCLFVSNN